MKPSLTAVTLGVRNFSKSLDFYKNAFGFPTKATKKDGVAFFKLETGIVLVLRGMRDLAKDAMVSPDGSGFPGFYLAHNVRSEKAVDDVFRQVTKLGARSVKKPQKASWGGYSTYVADPDGYLWEIVYNPFLKLDPRGRIILP
jgi:uncharacterized protein